MKQSEPDERKRKLLIAAEFLQKGQTKKAIKFAKDLFRSNVDGVEALLMLAAGLAQVGEMVASMLVAEAAQSMAPTHPGAMMLLGKVYSENGLYANAYPLLLQALRKVPASFDANFGMATYLAKVGLAVRANSYFRAALDCSRSPEESNLVRSAWASNLGSINLRDEAFAMLGELKRDGKYQQSSYYLAASLTGDGLNSPLGNEIRELLNDETKSSKARGEVLLMLGKLAENDKNYATAYDYWQKSRALLGQSKFDLASRQNDFELRKQFYTKEFFAFAHEHGSVSKRPVFVVGMPRSGTTLTEQVIAAHPEAEGVGETISFGPLDQSFVADVLTEDHLIRRVQGGELVARAQEVEANLDMLTQNHPLRIVEKSPLNFKSLGYIGACFPKAKIIWCRRHPADNFISAFQNHMNIWHDYSYAANTYAQEYLLHMQYREHWMTVLPGQILDFPYEATVDDFEGQARKLIAFIGLDWHDECLKFYDKVETVKTFSNQQVRRPIYKSSVERWRRYEQHLGPLFEELKKANFEYKV